MAKMATQLDHAEWFETTCPADAGGWGCALPSGTGWRLSEKFHVTSDDEHLIVFRWVRETNENASNSA